jgi:C-terminal processing protease CtpA/Prc
MELRLIRLRFEAIREYKMKKHLEWFIVPCVATMFAGNSVSLNAQEPSKAKRSLNVVVNHSKDDDAKKIREKIAHELANSGVAEDIQARILKDVEEALSKAQKKIAGKSTKSNEEAESKPWLAKEHAMKLLEKIEKSTPANGFKTHLFVDPKNDAYRIGVQCVQSEFDDGEETQEGLEVKAVFEDSPAQKAGLEEGDVLLTIDTNKIGKISDLTSALQEAGKNEKEVTIEAKRDEKVISVTVKPTKMKSSDIGLENIRLALPTEGFVVDGEMMKSVQDQMKNLGMAELQNSAQVFGFKSDSESLKKDLAELKAEMAELKKLIKELAGKKSE